VDDFRVRYNPYTNRTSGLTYQKSVSRGSLGRPAILFNSQPLISHLTNSNGCGNISSGSVDVSTLGTLLFPAPNPHPKFSHFGTAFVFSHLRTLYLSCRSFSHSDRLFSIACALFDKNTRGAIPLPEFHDSQITSHKSHPTCAKTQECPPVSPLPATLTHSLSRNPFACHSYANTRDGGAPLPKFFSPLVTRHYSF